MTTNSNDPDKVFSQLDWELLLPSHFEIFNTICAYLFEKIMEDLLKAKGSLPTQEEMFLAISSYGDIVAFAEEETKRVYQVIQRIVEELRAFSDSRIAGFIAEKKTLKKQPNPT